MGTPELKLKYVTKLCESPVRTKIKSSVLRNNFSRLPIGTEGSPETKKIIPKISKVLSKSRKNESSLEAKKIFFENFAKREGLRINSAGQCAGKKTLMTSQNFSAQTRTLTNGRAEPATGRVEQPMGNHFEKPGRFSV